MLPKHYTHPLSGKSSMYADRFFTAVEQAILEEWSNMNPMDKKNKDNVLKYVENRMSEVAFLMVNHSHRVEVPSGDPEDDYSNDVTTNKAE